MGVFLNDHGLEDEVLKHGSHNQKTHAGSRGGGAGGGGTSSGSKPSKESLLNRKRNNEKTNILSGRVQVLSGKIRAKDPVVADKLKAIESKLDEAGKAGVSNVRHYALINQSARSLSKIDNKHRLGFEEVGQFGNLQTTLNQLENYAVDLEQEIDGTYDTMARS